MVITSRAMILQSVARKQAICCVKSICLWVNKTCICSVNRQWDPLFVAAVRMEPLRRVTNIRTADTFVRIVVWGAKSTCNMRYDSVIYFVASAQHSILYCNESSIYNQLNSLLPIWARSHWIHTLKIDWKYELNLEKVEKREKKCLKRKWNFLQNLFRRS